MSHELAGLLFAFAEAEVAILTQVEKQCGWETVDVTIVIQKKLQYIIEFEGLIWKSENHGANTAYTISRAYTGQYLYERCFLTTSDRLDVKPDLPNTPLGMAVPVIASTVICTGTNSD